MTTYHERPLDEPQEPTMVRDFLIRCPTIPATLLLSAAVSFFSGSAAIWTRFVVLAVDEIVVREGYRGNDYAWRQPAMRLNHDLGNRPLAASKVLEVKGGKLLSHDFFPGGKAEYHRKDLGIALAAAREHGVVLPATAIVDQMFGALIAKGRGGWDHSALVTLVEEWSGLSGP